MDDLKTYLTQIAGQAALTDEEDFNPYDTSGGNFDDAFQQGMECGEIEFARSLLEKFF